MDIAKTDNDPGRYNYTYYIRTDDEYKPIGYVTNALIGDDKAYARGHFNGDGWYLIQSDGVGQKMIYDKVTGGTVYVRGSEDKTKLEMLQEATSTFTENFANTNDKSKIAVVGFSNTITYHDFVDASDADDIQKFIADPQEMAITGGTDMVGGLNEAQILLSGIAVKNDGNKKYVVLFSDGNPDSNPGSKASEIKADGTAIYTVGIYGGSVDVNECESMMKSAATDNSYYINANQSEDGLLGAFESIFNSITSSESAIVTDYIDPRFEVINTAGGVLREDEHGSYVEWNAVIGAADGEKAGWAKTITVKAKDEFIGGNNITTNIAPYSGVTYGSSSKFLAFPNQPAVNVKPRFYMGNAEVTIFRGEKVPPCTLEPYTLKSDGITKVTGAEMYIKESEVTGTFTYQWNKADGSPLSNTQEFPPNQYPDDDTHYTLIASFDPDASTDESKNNSDGHVAGETESCKGIKNLAKAEGIYTVNVIKGELDIIKNMVGKYPASDEVAAHQGFVFKIERSDTKGGAAVDTFYEVITPDAGKIKKITGLKEGYYKITEETGKGTGAWRYEQGSAIDNDAVSIGGYTSTNDDQLVYIGRETTESGAAVKSYFGSDGKNLHGVLANPAAIVFTNILNDKHWLSDTTVAVNTVTN